MTPEQFWAKVKKAEDGCWEWQAGGTRKRDGKKGYGSVQVNGKTMGAHRYAYMIAYGNIPEGMLVCHTCDNPPCCNPHHLWLGTYADNSADMVAKSRQARHGYREYICGKDCYLSKLTNEDVIAIRQAHESGANSKMELAQMFGISRSNISRIVNRKIWKHI